MIKIAEKHVKLEHDGNTYYPESRIEDIVNLSSTLNDMNQRIIQAGQTGGTGSDDTKSAIELVDTSGATLIEKLTLTEKAVSLGTPTGKTSLSGILPAGKKLIVGYSETVTDICWNNTIVYDTTANIVQEFFTFGQPSVRVTSPNTYVSNGAGNYIYVNYASGYSNNRVIELYCKTSNSLVYAIDVISGPIPDIYEIVNK